MINGSIYIGVHKTNYINDSYLGYENQISKLTNRDITGINHIDHIPKETNALLYYEESRENFFLFDNGAYELKLLQKRREISIQRIIN